MITQCRVRSNRRIFWVLTQSIFPQITTHLLQLLVDWSLSTWYSCVIIKDFQSGNLWLYRVCEIVTKFVRVDVDLGFWQENKVDTGWFRLYFLTNSTRRTLPAPGMRQIHQVVMMPCNTVWIKPSNANRGCIHFWQLQKAEKTVRQKLHFFVINW